MADYKALEKNIIDTIKESQIKIGYTYNAVGLYYPLDSLNNMLGTAYNVEEMTAALESFDSEKLGKLTVSYTEERFGIKVSADGVKYIHENVEASPFLTEFITAIAEHHSTIEQIADIFRKYSDKVVFKEISDDEFDYLVYFEDGVPDDYRYCLRDEMGHIIYHRFTPKDYENFNIK